MLNRDLAQTFKGGFNVDKDNDKVVAVGKVKVPVDKYHGHIEDALRRGEDPKGYIERIYKDQIDTSSQS